MSRKDYIECIVKMCSRIDNEKMIKRIYRFVHSIFIKEAT